METQAPEPGVRYHRRLDRSPEKAEFAKLPPQDKRLISNLRGVMQGARDKVNQLRNEVEERDLDVSRESALRKALESRLDQYVDMYGSPAVNDELEERLPEAARFGARKQREREIEMLRKQPEMNTARFDRQNVVKEALDSIQNDSEDADPQNNAGEKPPATESKAPATSTSTSGGPISSDRAPQGPLDASLLQHYTHNMGSLFPNFYPSVYAFPPQFVYPAMMPSTPNLMQPPSHQMGLPSGPHMMPTSASSAMPPPSHHTAPHSGPNAAPPSTSNLGPPDTSLLTGSSPLGQPASVAGMSPVVSSKQNPNLESQKDSSSAGGEGHKPVFSGTVYTVTHPVPSPRQSRRPIRSHHTGSSSPTQQLSEVEVHPPVLHFAPVDASERTTSYSVQHAPKPHSDERSAQDARSHPLHHDQPAAPNTAHMPSTDHPPALSAWDQGLQREQSRQISLLLAELNSAIGLNNELHDKLNVAENEKERALTSEELKEASLKAAVAQQAAELVEQIYKAQRERDEAVMGRLRLANEERDEALLKLKMNNAAPKPPENLKNNNNMDVQELVRNLANLDASHLSQQRAAMLEALKAKSSHRQHITTEEMKALLKERDSAVNKCRQLESQLMKLQQQKYGKNEEKAQDSLIQAKLFAVEHERDTALSEVKKLEEELQTLRVYYSLHKSLSQEANLRTQYNNSLDNIEGQLRMRDDTLTRAQKENNRLLAQLKSVVNDKQRLIEDLAKAQGAQKEAQSNTEKLERLVNVLRRKVTNMGFKIEDQREVE